MVSGGIIAIIIVLVIIVTVGVAIGIWFAVSGSGSTGSTGTNPNTPAFPNLQQGNKIVPVGVSTGSQTGFSVSTSEDGNTVVIGCPEDSGGVGCIFVYTRSEGVWSAQSTKLVGTGAIGNAKQGFAVEIDASGNGIIVGGPYDNSSTGAVWFFTRVNSAWSQVGSKIVPSDSTSSALFGSAVDVADTNFDYAVIGGPGDNSNIGATWVFKRSDTTWTQQGSKLVGSDRVGTSLQGTSLKITDAGDAFAVGGPGDNSNLGAFWVFLRSGETWSQASTKFVPEGAVGQARIGTSMDISGDEGNTLAIGGPNDNGNVGAVWLYSRSGSSLAQQGSKLVGTGASGQSLQGTSVSLSDSGRTLLVGAPGNNSNEGQCWTFTRNELLTWEQQGTIKGTGASGAAQQGYSVSLSLDGTTGIIGGYADNSSTGAVWVFIYSF